jgi:glycerol-3-phosphate cytidylyltransferase
MKNVRVMVDMSCTLIHHGHIRLLQKAAELGTVVVGLTTDEEIFLRKGYWPELNFEYRSEILHAVSCVHEVIPSKWLITNDFILENSIDILVHGDDNANQVDCCEIRIFPRTENISSSELRRLSYEIYTGAIMERNLE